MQKSCGCDYGMCTCGTTKEDIIRDLQKRINILENERASEYSSLRKFFEKTKNEEVKKQIDRIKLNNQEKSKLKKFVKTSMTKNKLNWLLEVWRELDDEDFKDIMESYQE